MPMKDYIITLEEGEMTPELRELLESKGATVREAAVEKLNLPPDLETRVLADLEAVDAGKTFKTWDQLSEELDAFIEERSSDV